MGQEDNQNNVGEECSEVHNLQEGETHRCELTSTAQPETVEDTPALWETSALIPDHYTQTMATCCLQHESKSKWKVQRMKTHICLDHKQLSNISMVESY